MPKISKRSKQLKDARTSKDITAPRTPAPQLATPAATPIIPEPTRSTPLVQPMPPQQTPRTHQDSPQNIEQDEPSDV